MAVIARDNVTGLIYAGGRATRMGGVDKGLELFRGRPLIEAVIDRLKPQCVSIVISANRNLERYAAWGIRLFVIWMMLLPDRSPLWLQLGLKAL